MGDAELIRLFREADRLLRSATEAKKRAVELSERLGKKPCSKCGRIVPLSHFQRRPGASGGRQAHCKDCHAASMSSARSRRPLRVILSNMIQRCHNPKHPHFHLYGGRGISVCDLWRARGGYERFARHIGPRPSAEHSVDRINNEKGYEPGNVRWATQYEQMANTRRTVRITANGETLTLRQWSKRSQIPLRTIEWRLREGHWEPERAVTEPVQRSS